MARRGLLDVPGHEPRPARAGRAQRVDVQPQLRGTPGQGRSHAPRVAAGRRRHRRDAARSPRPPTCRATLVSRGLSDDGEVHHATPASACRCAAATSTPTRSSRRSTSSASPAPASRTACSRPGATTRASCSTGPSTPAGTVLVAGPDFGTGSSREHAVWALQNYGFKVVISLTVRRHLPRQLRQGRTASPRRSTRRSSSSCGTTSSTTRQRRSTVDLESETVQAGAGLDASRTPSRSTTTPAGGCSRASTTSASRCRTRTTSRPTRPRRRPGSRPLH